MRLWISAVSAVMTLVMGVSSAGAALQESLAKANDALEGYDLPAARAVLDEVPADRRDHPMVVYMKAKAAFYGGDYVRAVESYQSLLREGRLAEEDHVYSLALAAAAAMAGAARKSSGHFMLAFDETRDWPLAETALDVLEAAYRGLGEVLGVYPAEPVRVEIYAEPEAFQKASSLTRRDIENSGAIGICKFNRIMMLSPRTLSHGYRWMDTLSHEYLHYLLTKATANRAPIWVQEGVAKYFEKHWRNRTYDGLWPQGASLMAEALEKGTLIDFKDMDPSLVKLDSLAKVSLAYAECETAVAFIIGRAGLDGLKSFLGAVGRLEPGGTARALEETLGLGYAAFQEAWRLYLGGLKLAKMDVMLLPSFALSGGGGDEDLWRQIRSETASAAMGLGDVFRRGGRHRAALSEYRKALSESPGSPMILNRLAMTSLALGDAGAASAYLDEAAAVAPDYPLTYRNMAELHLSRGEAGRSLAALDEYNGINPFNPEIYYLKGKAWLMLGAADEAERQWNKSLRLEPNNMALKEELASLKRAP